MKDTYAAVAGPAVLDEPDTLVIAGEMPVQVAEEPGLEEVSVQAEPAATTSGREYDGYGRDVTDWICFEGDGRTGPFSLQPTKARPHP